MNQSIKNRTVGQYSYELLQKNDKINPIDLQRQIHKGNTSKDSYENQLLQALERGKSLYEQNFFLVVLFKKERLMINTVRQYFFPRRSCPTPEYDQVVYFYKRKSDNLFFIWIVPDKETCKMLYSQRKNLSPEFSELVRFVADFKSGKLDKISDDLNYIEKIF